MAPEGEVGTLVEIPGQPAFIERTPEELEEIAVRDLSNPVPLYLLSHVLRRRGDSRWRTAATAALRRPHTAPQHIYGRAIAKIMDGDWSGWTDHESRFRGPDTIRDLYRFSPICWKHQQWDGREDLAGGALVVLPEQGLGDCMQMWRLMPALLEAVESPTLMLYPRLIALARHNFGSRARIWLHDVKPTFSFDRYVWSMSLPAIFGGLPPFTPLRAPRRRIPLPERERPVRAGLCWAGNPDYPLDRERSIPFGELAPLLGRRDVEWLSLQVGQALDRNGMTSLSEPDPPLVTFADTADVMAELDYVVTVDTSVAHLAGLMGVPTYLLLQFDSHWRWGLHETTPWYPSMRLIRQRTFGDWRSALCDLGELLDRRDRT